MSTPAKEGAIDISGFLGYWFIRKAMWASASSIRSNAASLKKFYTFMVEHGNTSSEDLELMNESIREEMEEWISILRRHEDESITDMEDVWGA